MKKKNNVVRSQQSNGVIDSNNNNTNNTNRSVFMRLFYLFLVLLFIFWFIKSKQRFDGVRVTTEGLVAMAPKSDAVFSLRVTHQIVGAATAEFIVFWLRTSGECLVRLTVVEHKKGDDDAMLVDDSIVTAGMATFLSEKKVTQKETDFTLSFEVPTKVFEELRTRHYTYFYSLNGQMDSSSISSLKVPSFTVGASSYNNDNTITHEVTFAAGSCMYSSYKPFSIFRHILNANPDFVLFMGDQIYADYPRMIDKKEEYEEKYKENFGDTELRSVLGRIPSFMMWDDHELVNNYDAGNDTELYRIARSAYQEYVGAHNPSPRVPGQLYYSFNTGIADFYVMDLRSHRSRIDTPHSDPHKTLLGTLQKQDLKAWLSASTATFKVIASSVMWNTLNKYAKSAEDEKTGKRKELAVDAWSWYRRERDEILGFVKANNITGVLLLSGDSHFSGAFCWGFNQGRCEFLEFLVGPYAMGTDFVPTFPSYDQNDDRNCTLDGDPNGDCSTITSLFTYNNTKSYGHFKLISSNENESNGDSSPSYGVFKISTVDGMDAFSLLFRPNGSFDVLSIDQTATKEKQWKGRVLEDVKQRASRDVKPNKNPSFKKRKPINTWPLTFFLLFLFLCIFFCMNNGCLEALNQKLAPTRFQQKPRRR